MGNDLSLSRRSSVKQTTKQSKKWRISSRKYVTKREREREPHASLDVISPQSSACTQSRVISWNCHHKLEVIEETLMKHRSNLDKIKLGIPFKQRHALNTELDDITNGVSKTIHGITHNYLDGVPNERALLDFWMDKVRCNADDNAGIGVIVFEIASMDKIHQTLGWQSGDNIIIETGKKIDEYCRWYSSDYSVKFKLFHPDFALNEFIVVSTCTDDQVIEDLCDCLLVDIARSVKCFFQQTTVWAGYATNSEQHHQNTKEIDDIRYNFRSWYEKAKCAIRDAMIVSKYSEEPSDRIRKWLSPEQKAEKGETVANIIHSFYRSKYVNQSESDEPIHINEAIEAIDHEMKHGADLNYTDKSGNTPFFYAIATKQNQLMNYLLKYEFDIDHRDPSGRTALVQALRYDVAESICCILAERLKYPNIPDNNNVTSFVWALNCGYFKVMDILREKGAMDYKNWIISCCMKDQEIILCDIVRDNGITFACKLDEIGRCILHYAVLYKAHRIIHVCLKNRYIHPDVIDNNGWSPLHYAAAKNYLKSISLLMKYDADIRLKTEENYQPIHIAERFNKNEATVLIKRYEMERRDRLERYRLSIAHPLNATNPMAAIKIISTPKSDAQQSNESDSDDVYEDDAWDKENEDPNTMMECRTRGNSDSQSKTQSQSNSENVYKTYRAYKVPNVSVIDEDGFVSKVLDDEDNDCYDLSESNHTLIIHESEDSEDDDEKEEVSMNDSCNEIWNKTCLERVEMELIASPN
eukprot:35703_1